jgi:riboflavin kinase/FMN adenylyltransferase
MKILRSITEYQPGKSFLAVTLGNFDGVHLGHQQLLKRAVAAAAENGGESMLFTFRPHPMTVLAPRPPQFLADNEEKRRAVAACGLDYMLEFPFTPQIAAQSPEYFVRFYLREMLEADLVIVGFNFHFGAGGAGSVEDLQRLGAEQGIAVEVMPPYEVGEGVVSSSRIRRLIAGGQIAAANSLLGREYVLAGEIVHGRQIGRTIGFPTANVAVDASLQLPAYGVYAAYAEFVGDEAKSMPAVVNVGLRPTVGENLEPTVEVHCLGADGDFYGKNMRVRFVRELRSEQKFASLEDLQAQIARDSEQALKILQ